MAELGFNFGNLDSKPTLHHPTMWLLSKRKINIIVIIKIMTADLGI